MANLVVKGQTYNYPDSGREPGWGEDATAWAKAVTEALASAIAPGDIRGDATLIPANTPTAIIGVQISNVQSVSGRLFYHLEAGTNYQSGILTFTRTSNNWQISREYVGNDIPEITFSVTPTGQIQYTSTLTGNATFRYRFVTVEV
jgi:hypothetical protein